MRNAFSEEITRLGQQDHRVVLLSGDIGNKLFDDFKERCPNRFINCGIAEANMMGVAAGLAMNGLRPVVYTITPFTTTRCLEQIRVDVCYQRVPVLIVGTGAGLAYAELGPTHHSCEDFAIMRVLPDMTVFAPCDSSELRLGLQEALRQDGPVYMRIGKKGEPAIHRQLTELRFGSAISVRTGRDLCLIVAGTIMGVALETADLLEQRGISVQVESFHSVKPLDQARLDGIFADYRVVATIEEHSVIGGLGGAVSEYLTARPQRPKARLLSFGVADAFMHDIGSQSYARGQSGLSAGKLTETLSAVWAECSIVAAG